MFPDPLLHRVKHAPPRVSDLWLPPYFWATWFFAPVINGRLSMSWGLVKSEQKSWEGKDTWEKCFHPFSRGRAVRQGECKDGEEVAEEVEEVESPIVER